MGWWIGYVLLPACLLGGWLVLRRPLRQVFDDMNGDQARLLFRRQRELLEARFVSSLSRVDPIEGLRWEDAHWEDEIQWARDRRSRELMALVGVHFDPSPFLDEGDPNRYATAVFEYRKGAWKSEGICLPATLPHEAYLRHQRIVPVVPPPPPRV